MHTPVISNVDTWRERKRREQLLPFSLAFSLTSFRIPEEHPVPFTPGFRDFFGGYFELFVVVASILSLS